MSRYHTTVMTRKPRPSTLLGRYAQWRQVPTGSKELTTSEKQELEELWDAIADAKERLLRKLLELNAAGVKFEDFQGVFSVDARTINRWCQEYKKAVNDAEGPEE